MTGDLVLGDAIRGVCGTSPRAVREMRVLTDDLCHLLDYGPLAFACRGFADTFDHVALATELQGARR